MKKILAILLALVMILGLAACGSSGSTGGTEGTAGNTENNGNVENTNGENQDNTGSTETIKLTVWVGDLYVDATNQMIESFKAAYPDYNFEITVGIESESTCKDTILTDPTAAADVYTFADDQLLDLVNNGAIQAIQIHTDEIIAANGEGSVNAATVDGTLYAYPMSASNGYFLYYDSSFFTADDVTNLNAMCEKAAAEGKKIAMQFGTDGGWYLYSFFHGAGLTMHINDDGLTNSCDWNCDTGVNVAQGVLDLVSTGAFVAMSDSDMVAAAKEGTVVALINGTWNAGPMQEAYGENYACAKLPTFNCGGEAIQMGSFAGYKLIGVNPHSEQAGWAQLLAEWLTNEENQTLRFTTNGDGPSNTAAAASDAVAADPAIAALAQQSAYAVVQRVGNNYWSAASTLGEILAQGNPEGTDLLELLNNAVTGITADIA